MHRYVRLFGTPITLLVLLGVLFYGAWWGYQNVIKPPPARVPDPCVTQSVGSQLKTSQVTVKVYNGGSKTGLAGTVGAQLKAAGFKVAYIGNTDERIAKTLVVGASAENPEVKLLLGFFKDATVRADQRSDGTVEVLVGREFGGMNPKAARTMAVPGGAVCLPSPTPSPTPSAAAAGTAKPAATSKPTATKTS